jgi:hypothetical protein
MADNETEKGTQRLWFVRRDGKVRGPFPSGTVRRFVLVGRISPGDEVSNDRKSWQAVAQVPEVLSPEVRKALKEGDLASLLPAQMREDERTGRERREKSEDAKYAGRRKGERRQGETDVAKGHREAKTNLRELRSQRTLPVSGILAIGLLISLAVGYGFYIGAPEAIPEPDCLAKASPGVNWRNCRVESLEAESADMDGALLNNGVFPGARLSGSRINNADLQYADLSRADLSYVEFRGSLLKGANLARGDLSYADLSGADLSFSNLTDANLGGARLEGAIFDHAIWLDGRKCQPGSVGGCRVGGDPASR